MTEHLSAFTLDALALNALDEAAAARARAHLASCAQCRADDESAAALREHFTVHVLPRTAPVRRRRSWRWIWLAAPMLAAAAILLVLRREPPPPELGIKGDATWQVFAHRAGKTFEVHDGAVLAAGDEIRFVVVPDRARFVLIVSVDGAGQASIYYPYNGAASAPIDGPRVELAGSIVLDAAPGPERLFALFSDEPIAAPAARDALRAIAMGGADAIRRTRQLPIPVRAQTTLLFEKGGP